MLQGIYREAQNNSVFLRWGSVSHISESLLSFCIRNQAWGSVLPEDHFCSHTGLVPTEIKSTTLYHDREINRHAAEPKTKQSNEIILKSKTQRSLQINK